MSSKGHRRFDKPVGTVGTLVTEERIEIIIELIDSDFNVSGVVPTWVTNSNQPSIIHMSWFFKRCWQGRIAAPLHHTLASARHGVKAARPPPCSRNARRDFASARCVCSDRGLRALKKLDKITIVN